MELTNTPLPFQGKGVRIETGRAVFDFGYDSPLGVDAETVTVGRGKDQAVFWSIVSNLKLELVPFTLVLMGQLQLKRRGKFNKYQQNQGY